MTLYFTIKCSYKIHQGGAVAAPVGGKILTDVLSYLELEKDDVSEDEIIKRVSVPDIRGMSVKEAKSLLKESGLLLELKEAKEVSDEEIITTQIPMPETQVNENSKVYYET